MKHDLIDDGPGWEQQQEYEEHEQWELANVYGKLQELVSHSVDDDAERYEDLGKDELKLMTAAVIRASNPDAVWESMKETTQAGLVADALENEYGGCLGIERSRDRLLKAVLAGAVQYARPIIEHELYRQVQARSH